MIGECVIWESVNICHLKSFICESDLCRFEFVFVSESCHLSLRECVFDLCDNIELILNEKTLT